VLGDIFLQKLITVLYTSAGLCADEGIQRTIGFMMSSHNFLFIFSSIEL